MSVSIIIPNYNGGEYLAACLDSCLNQGNYVKEVIVVDDGSKDNSFDIIQTYEAAHPHLIKGVRNTKKGACAARNLGFEVSTQEYIQFLDSDDILGANKIELQLKQLLNTGDPQNKLIHGRWGRFFQRIDEDINWGPHFSIRKNLSPIDWLTIDHMSMTACWLTHRSLILKGGGWNENLLKNQDGEFFSRLMTHTNEVLYNDESQVFYRSGNANSVSQTVSRPAAASFLESITLIEGYVFSLEKSQRTQLALANKYQYFAFSNYTNYPELAVVAEKRAHELGGYTIIMPGSFALRILSRFFGWKQALKIKRTFAR